MTSFDDREDLYNAPITTSDAAAMLRRKVQRNDRPYVAETTKLNNKKVDDWKETVLDRIADSRGMVPSGRVWGSWLLYDEGHGVVQYQKLKEMGVISEISSDVLEFWKNFFESKSVAEMHSYGSGVVSHGWGVIQNYIKMWFADEKYRALFSKYESPLDWEKNSHAHKPLLHGEVLPFWDEETLKDIQQKVASILMNTVKPQDSQGGFR